MQLQEFNRNFILKNLSLLYQMLYQCFRKFCLSVQKAFQKLILKAQYQVLAIPHLSDELPFISISFKRLQTDQQIFYN
jgi:hypothetical protein